MIAAQRVSMAYGATPALRDVSVNIEAGASVALMGASGSGKSTLLHCLAGIISPDSGEIVVDGVAMSDLNDRERSRLRLERMGIVFQFGGLVPELSVIENVMLPLQLIGTPTGRARGRAGDVLDGLGIGALEDARPAQISGGQAQRAAVARAIVHEPAVLLADEPTGALDSLNAESVMDALVSMTRDMGTTLLVVTHDNVVASHLDSFLTMHDGELLPAFDEVGA